MQFFDDLGKKLKDVVSSAGKVAQDVTESTKLNLTLKTKENEIQELYAQIGKAYYARRQAGTESTESLDVLCAQLDALIDDMNALESEIATRKGQVHCPSCGSVQSTQSAYCSECGEKLPEIVAAEPTQEYEEDVEVASNQVEEEEEVVEEIHVESTMVDDQPPSDEETQDEN